MPTLNSFSDVSVLILFESEFQIFTAFTLILVAFLVKAATLSSLIMLIIHVTAHVVTATWCCALQYLAV